MTVITIVVRAVVWVTMSLPASTAGGNLGQMIRFALFPLWSSESNWIIVDHFVGGWVLQRELLLLLRGISTNDMSLFIQDSRIFSVQNTLLVYNLTKSISGNHPTCCIIVFHCAMFPKLVPLNLMVFGVIFHERFWLKFMVHFNQILSQTYPSIWATAIYWQYELHWSILTTLKIL